MTQQPSEHSAQIELELLELVEVLVLVDELLETLAVAPLLELDVELLADVELDAGELVSVLERGLEARAALCVLLGALVAESVEALALLVVSESPPSPGPTSKGGPPHASAHVVAK